VKNGIGERVRGGENPPEELSGGLVGRKWPFSVGRGSPWGRDFLEKKKRSRGEREGGSAPYDGSPSPTTKRIFLRAA